MSETPAKNLYLVTYRDLVYKNGDVYGKLYVVAQNFKNACQIAESSSKSQIELIELIGTEKYPNSASFHATMGR